MKKYSGPSVLSGNQNLAIPPHVNYGRFVLDKLLQKKDKVALINGESGDQITYGEMAQQVVNTASSLINLGVGAGDVIGVCSENRTEFLITAIAGMCTEGVVTFINSAYSTGVEKTALILYSSGTTGLPKGAKLSHRNLITTALQPLSFRSGLVCLTLAPWSNTVGIILTMDELIYNETVVYLNRFKEENYLKCIEKYKVGVLLAVPPLIVLLNNSIILQKYDISSVELIYSGGSPMDESVIKKAKTRFPNLKHVLQGYGMTESSGAVTEDDDQAPRQGSVGRVVDGLIVKVVDVESRKLLGANQVGEICLKGPALFQGYIGKDLCECVDNEGFYCSGDVAYYDEDGYFFIVDRIKELIKYKAGQVSPSEIEAILRQHPAVKDTGVTGTPDPLVGELPTAFVVKSDEVVTEKELIDFVGSKVSSWKQLRGGVRFVQEIPKTGSGKILRRKLREMLAKPPTSKL